MASIGDFLAGLFNKKEKKDEKPVKVSLPNGTSKTSTPSGIPQYQPSQQLFTPKPIQQTQSFPVRKPSTTPTKEETQKARIQSSIAPAIGPTQFGKELFVAPALARQAISFGQSIKRGVTGEAPEPYRPKSSLGKFLLEPSKDFKGIEDVQTRLDRASKLGEDVTNTKTGGLAFSALGIPLLTTAELLPGGGGKKKIATEIEEGILKSIKARELVGNIRLDKFNLPEESQVELGKLILDNSGFVAQRRGVQSIEETQRLADTLIPNLNLKKGTALNAEEIQSLGNAVTGLQSKVDNFAQKIASGENADDTIAMFQLAKQELAFGLESLAGATAESGRSLRQLRELRKIGDTKDIDLINKAVKLSGGRENAINVAKKLVELENDTDKIKYIQSLSRPGFDSKFQELWVNSILSNPVTHIVNITGNTVRALLNPPIKAVQAGIETFRPGQRQIFFGEVPQEIFGLFGGLTDGVKKASYVLRNGLSISEASKLDIGRVPSIKGLTGEVVRTPTKFLSAADEFFKTIVGTSQTRALAYREAKREGLTGVKFNERVGELIANPTKKILDEVDYRKLESTYQLELGKSGKALSNFLNTSPGAKYIVPFFKTPTNIAKDAFRTSPVGFLDIMTKLKTGKFKDLPDNESTRRLAQAAIGSVMAAFVVQKTLEGKITGSTPKDPTERQTFYDIEGKQPYSIRIGDKWVSYARVEPFATIFGATADITKLTQEEDIADASTKIVFSIANNLKDKTFLSGVSQFIESIDDPTKAEKWISNLASGFVPFSGTARFAQRLSDPSLRTPDTFKERVQANLPIVSKQLPPRRTVFGEVINRPLSQRVSPFGMGDAETIDPTIQKLRDSGIQINQISNRVGGMKLTNEEFNLYTGVIGKTFKKIMDNVVQTPGWETLSKNDQQEAVDDIRLKIATEVRKALFPAKELRSDIQKQFEDSGLSSKEANKKSIQVVEKLEQKIRERQ
jgi:hypothetical protein